MVRRLAMLLASVALALTAGPLLAHHSFAMFDREHQIDLEGVVQEFRFANPHSFIYLAVKQPPHRIAMAIRPLPAGER